MKKKKLKALSLQKISISNFGIKGGADSPSNDPRCGGVEPHTFQLNEVCCTITQGCPPSHIICPTEPDQVSKQHM